MMGTKLFFPDELVTAKTFLLFDFPLPFSARLPLSFLAVLADALFEAEPS